VRRCAGGILLQGKGILLGRRASNRGFYPNVWDIIGGHCETGEEPEETLVREMKEEIDVTPCTFTKCAVLWEPAPECHGEAEYHVFVVTAWVGRPVALGDEHAEIRWFRLEEAMELDLAHPAYRDIFVAIRDGRTGATS